MVEWFTGMSITELNLALNRGGKVLFGIHPVHGLLQFFPPADLRRLERLLVSAGLPVRLPDGIDPDRIVHAAGSDKKNREGTIRCALPVRLGEMIAGPDPVVPVTIPDLAAALAAD